jgi:hypothetical protein
MSAASAKGFTKTRACPSLEDTFSSKLPRGNSAQIARHTAGCEFCAAEQSFLSARNQTTEYEPAEMPAYLRRLAKALLIGKLNDSYKGSRYGTRLSPTRSGLRI